MMMKMLEAGGLDPLIDNIRQADKDNPKGYYEFERVKALPKGDTAWLPDAGGKVVKIISALLEHLPVDYQYQVIFMRRNMDEILASQRKMLDRRGEKQDDIADEKWKQMYGDHLYKVENMLKERSCFHPLYVHYNMMLQDPGEQAKRVLAFLNKPLDLQRMVSVVDPSLYRQRGTFWGRLKRLIGLR